MDWLQKARWHSEQLTKRTFHRQLRLGVTGLSGAGKTALLTAMVHQLTQSNSSVLPFFSVMQQRWLGARIDQNQSPQLPRFSFEKNLSYLQQQPARWPPSTVGWSQLTLALRYQPESGLRARFQDYQDTELVLVDYPGEWLLDLPMLQQSYRQWCEQSWTLFAKPHRIAAAQDFQQRLQGVDLNDTSVLSVQDLCSDYCALLRRFRDLAGAYLNQPGRLLVPGEFEGTPLLQLLPLLPEQLDQGGALVDLMQKQFANYQSKVIEPFYQQYFSALDRQVVLVDILGALNAGESALLELKQSLLLILQSFDYGPEHWLRRIFKPRISKVLFAASKADHVTPDQHQALILLLQQLLLQHLQTVKFQLCPYEVMAIAAIKASEAGFVIQNGQQLPCLRGRSATTGEALTYYPGDVPRYWPDHQLFTKHHFDFQSLAPLPWPQQHLLGHIRMDHLLEYLLGDKLT
ncbi:YcjX family protein [Rheinheimera sp.]|uniref:YcjX family protein n=1 Tax=Rheinheimera sp. TaxID=1869214 RepID=UPI002613BE88|nr:YcjX family protein [Rheinheimera sp.]MCA1928599.1 YcjX family protein [Rheinheimera sp.]